MQHEGTGTGTDPFASRPLSTALTCGRSRDDEEAPGRAASVSPERYHDLPQAAAPVTVPGTANRIGYQLGWQIRTTRVLADLLKLAHQVGLPAIAWMVGDAGTNLAGRCYGRAGADRRREFEPWCAAVAATPRPEFTGFSGVTYLRAIAPRYDGLVDVVVLADLYPDDQSEDDR